jgi:hypothetical protein
MLPIVRRAWAALVVVCGCDYVFRIDRVDLPGTDARADDAAAIRCGRDPDGVVAYYPIDGDGDTTQITDRGPAALHGSVSAGSVATTTGPAGCGEALQIIDGREASIPHDERFELASGSVDLWLRPIPLSSPSPTRVVIARDLGNNNAGDLSVFEHRLATAELILIVRLQSGSTTISGGGTYRCSHVTLTAGSWYHVAVNFGPPGLELYVDEVLQTGAQLTTLNGEAITCGTSTADQDAAAGIAGATDKSWFLGYGDVFETQVVRRFLSSGALDHIRVSSERF